MPFQSPCSIHMSNCCINHSMGRQGSRISGRIRIAHCLVPFFVIVAALAPNASADRITIRGRSILDSTNTRRVLRNLVTTAYVTDIGECYKDLITADSNNDESMSSDEYVQFINLQSGNQFANVTSFKDLPLELIQLFNFEACDCQTTSCCATNNNSSSSSSSSSTNAATPAINITSLANTTSFCSDVTSTLASVTNGATSNPTVSPTTQAPTKLSTARPTTAPTNATFPTLSPTNQTSIPTPAPTTNLTLIPTAAPTTSQELYTGPWNVSIAFVGCNVLNYTISDIMREQNNTMIQTILSHLGNRSSQVLTESLRRHRRDLTDMTRQLSVSWNDASIIHVKTVGTYLPFRLIEPSFLWL
jgi:hypothetical protein